jgi:hypothetical protein
MAKKARRMDPILRGAAKREVRRATLPVRYRPNERPLSGFGRDPPKRLLPAA